jgi:hypothetical protein
MGAKRLVFLSAFLALSWYTANADPIVISPTVALGTDYFQTQPGTFFIFSGGSFGTGKQVNFVGLPVGPFSTDTIIQRQADATINGSAIPIQIVALSLRSTQPVIFNGVLYNVFVTLDPAHLAQDTGTLTVHGTLAGGTFDSTLNVFFLAKFVPIGGGQGVTVSDGLTLSQTGGPWGPTPPPGSVIVRGPDDGSTADLAANLHTGLDSQEVDFFGSATERHENGAKHIVRSAVTPEPSSLLLIGPALAAVFLRWKLRHRRLARPFGTISS